MRWDRPAKQDCSWAEGAGEGDMPAPPPVALWAGETDLRKVWSARSSKREEATIPFMVVEERGGSGRKGGKRRKEE